METVPTEAVSSLIGTREQHARPSVRSGRGLIFDIANHTLLGALALLCVLPFILVVIASFSAEKSLNDIGIWFIPTQWSILPYQIIFQSSDILRSYEISIGVTVVGTSLS